MKRKVKVRESVLGTVGSGLHILVIVGKFFQQGQRQGEGVLGHHARAVIHHIAYLDPPALTVGQIHIVKAGGQFADQADMGRVFQGLLPERSLIGHDNLRVPHPLTDFLNRGGIVVVNHLSQMLILHRDVSPHAVSFQYHNFHDFLLFIMEYFQNKTM